MTCAGGSHVDTYWLRELVSTAYFLKNYSKHAIAEFPAPEVRVAFPLLVKW